MRSGCLQQSLIAAGFAAALAGCGEGATVPATRPVPGCAAFDHTPCDVRVASCTARLFALAACLRGDVPGDLPPVTVLTEVDFASLLTMEAAMQTVSPHLATWDWALSSLRLIEPGGLSAQTTVSESAAFIWGRYRGGSSKDIQIIDHGAAFDAQSASPVLIHEMIHALQDREVDLAQFHATFEMTTDSRLAARSITEGEARLHESRYRASTLGLDPAQVDWTSRFKNAVDRDEQQLAKEASPLTATSRVFPYEWGAHYVYNRWGGGGMSAVHGLFLAPPRTTQVLMASADADVDVDPEPAPAPPTPPTPPPGWTMVDSDVLGGAGLFLVLTKSTPDTATATIEALALGWRSDGIGIFEGPAGATAVVWRIELGDAGVAAQVAALLRGLPKVTVSLVESSITLATTTDGGLDWAFSPSS